jgi:PIN domain
LLETLNSFSSAIEKHFEEKFKALGIKVLPLPKIEIETLVRMSIDGTPPFEEKASEKGFRDAVTMFSILEEIENRTEDHALVITGDALLTEGLLAYVATYATVVHCVDGFPAAHKHIEKQLTASYRDYLRHESEEAKGVLLGYESTLQAKIAEIREIEPTDFGGLFGVIKDEKGASLSLEKVLSVKFAGIEAALWKDRDKPHSKILFRIKCEANVVVHNPYLSIAGVPRYSIGGPVIYSTQRPETFEKTVPLWFYGQAILAKKDSTWVLEDMRIDRRMPDQQDFFDLMRAAAPMELA